MGGGQGTGAGAFGAVRQMMEPLSRSVRLAAGLIAVALALVLFAAPGAWAATPSVDIHSAGPLSDIYIGNDLSCQVRSGGFSSTEFFPNAAGPGDCGTFLFITPDGNSGFFGPDFPPGVMARGRTPPTTSTRRPATICRHRATCRRPNVTSRSRPNR